MDDAGKFDERMSFDSRAVRRCAFCSQQVDASFRYCPHCGRRLSQARWYYSTWAVIIGLVTLGPLALPLVWFHPRYTTPTKILITVLVLALTMVLLYLVVLVYLQLIEQLRQLIATR